jgi:hypothetical protein
MCLFPAQFPVLAYGFAAACGVTTLVRWRAGWVLLAEARPEDMPRDRTPP